MKFIDYDKALHDAVYDTVRNNREDAIAAQRGNRDSLVLLFGEIMWRMRGCVNPHDAMDLLKTELNTYHDTIYPL